MNNEIVSFDDEKLILVNDNDDVVGYKDKLECHLNDGVLHRAFSIFLFNNKGEVLLQKRAADKMLWGNYWSNTCCSHPRKGESFEVATVRRLKEEVGIETPLTYLYKFIYTAKFNNIGSENELCYVYVGVYNKEFEVNKTEISDTKWVAIDKLSDVIEADPDSYTPWFKMEWQMLMHDFRHEIEEMIKNSETK